MRPKLEDLTATTASTGGQHTADPPPALCCPQCGTATQRWQQRRICRDCGISWADPHQFGLRETPTGDTGTEVAPPLLGGDDQ